MRDTSLRIALLRALGGFTLTSGEAARMLEVTQDHASHTLRHLAAAGVLQRQRVGRRRGGGIDYRYQLAVPIVWRDRTDWPPAERRRPTLTGRTNR